MASKKTKQCEPSVVNIGLIGHVDHGKTTLTERLTGKWTDTHSEELKRGITIRIGYADASFYKCPKCPEPQAYTTKETCQYCGSKTKFLRKVSFVDCPGHTSLMATMLSGATLMDGAILLIAANEKCPQPQTKEHLVALQVMGIKNVVIAQNKVDIVSKERALESYKEIKEFLSKTPYKDAPIIPISAQQNLNIDALIEALEKNVPTPKRDQSKEPLFFVARSFDINKPGTEIKDLKGAVLGGALVQGKLKVGQEIEIRPGFIYQDKGQYVAKPIITKIISLTQGNCEFDEVVPGGTVAIQTSLDPAIGKQDSLSGNVVGLPGKLPPIRYHLDLEAKILEKAVGDESEERVEPLKLNEFLLINVNSATTGGRVVKIEGNKVKINLELPVCVESGKRVAISRIIKGKFRLIGYGVIQ